jgi:hypothetical protein
MFLGKITIFPMVSYGVLWFPMVSGRDLHRAQLLRGSHPRGNGLQRCEHHWRPWGGGWKVFFMWEKALIGFYGTIYWKYDGDFMGFSEA